MANNIDNNTPLRVLLEGQGQEWASLPIEAAQLHAAFDRLGIQSPGDLRVAGVTSPIQSIGAVLDGETNLDALNTIAVFLSDMPDHQYILAGAIAEMDLSQFGDSTLDVLVNVLGNEDNLTGFEVIDAHNETELGRYWAREENLDITSDAELAAYGRENMEDGGMFTEWGYVRCQFKPEMLYDSMDLPAKCKVVDAAFQIGAAQVDKGYPPVYPHGADTVRQNGELGLYRESNKLSDACAQAIDQAVRDNNYKLYHYDLPAAAKSVMAEYGAGRVQWVLADTIQRNEWDGRYSHNNKEWAKGFDIPERKMGGPVINTHPAILDGFVDKVRGAILEKEVIAPPAPEQDGASVEYKYYSLRRPLDVGTIPREPKPVKVSNFDDKMYVENMAFSAWGAVTYKQPLTGKQVEDYELRAASGNPREKASVLDSLKENQQAAARSAPDRKAADRSGPER